MRFSSLSRAHWSLAKDQCARDKLENLINAGIGHRVTADGHTGTVDHQIFTFVTVRTVKGIREADINRFIETAIGQNSVRAISKARKGFTTFSVTS